MASEYPFSIPVRWTEVRLPFQIKHAETAWDDDEENAKNQRAYKKAIMEWINSNVNLHGWKVKAVSLNGNLGIESIRMQHVEFKCTTIVSPGKTEAAFPRFHMKHTDCTTTLPWQHYSKTALHARMACEALIADGFLDRCSRDIHDGAMSRYYTDA